MSEEMALVDSAMGEEAAVNGDDAVAASVGNVEPAEVENPTEPAPPEPEEPPAPADECPTKTEQVIEKETPTMEVVVVKSEPVEDGGSPWHNILADGPMDFVPPTPIFTPETKDLPEAPGLPKEPEVVPDKPEEEDKRGLKRRASAAFSDDGEEFRGFDEGVPQEEEFKGFNETEKNLDLSQYSDVVERLEAEVTAAHVSFAPLKSVMATPPVPRAVKRPRQDTDGSRPSSALSSRSDGDGVLSNEGVSSSPANRGRRPTTEMSSAALRVPLERGWRRELVYRAALDAHSRRNADIYYYSPQGKKLRSTREVSEHLSGTGLTLENFSFFKEPLGIDDPEKEIIRDAKMTRKLESPVSSPASISAEGKRTPKPKPPKGASPEPNTPKSPPAKLKVKSVGSRLSNNSTNPAATPSKQKKPSNATDNNNTTAWKKPRQTAALPHQPPPLQSRPQPQPQPDIKSPRQVVQPCSMTCGRGVPTLTCTACLCLYHPACAGYVLIPPPDTFYCKNCRKSTSPPLEPPPLIHKSGVPVSSVAPSLPAPVPRRVPGPVPVPVPVPVPNKVRPDKRVLLRMKVAGGGPDGERVWAVAKPQPGAVAKPQLPPPPRPTPAPSPRALALRPSLPQSLAMLNGRRFIVVPRNMVQPSAQHEDKRRGRVANGAASPEPWSPRRRGRAKADDTDYFTTFYAKAQEKNYNVVVQIFQYLGMRDLAHCARVCKMWQEMASTPALWRHVRMKNSHVSDWGGLCASLKRHGTKRLDLRKMLLPQNDTVFWEQFAQHIAALESCLERIEMCRCPASALEAVCRGLPNLRSLSALSIRDDLFDPSPLGALPLLHELRLKSMSGLSLTRDLRPLAALQHLHHLSLTSIKELGWCASDVVGQLSQLETLELGECTFRAEFAAVLAKLHNLRRLRLERGTAQCAAPAILRALSRLPNLRSLELVNVDIKVGFDDALAECKNIQRLLIIPTYVSQSATTNKQVLSGVLRLKDTLTHLMWGVTIELLRVTELFIDQCEQSGEKAHRDIGECIPVLKPVPGCKLPAEHHHVATPPQVEIVPLPTLQRLLSAQLPHTKLKLLRIPFHATWRQSLADFQ